MMQKFLLLGLLVLSAVAQELPKGERQAEEDLSNQTTEFKVPNEELKQKKEKEPKQEIKERNKREVTPERLPRTFRF